jgi:hypothetical protein
MMSKEFAKFSAVEEALSSIIIRSGAMPFAVSQSYMHWASVMSSPLPRPPDTIALASGYFSR